MEINLEVLYIIIGIIYFIYSVIKNISKKPVTRQDEVPENAEGEETQRPHRRETVSNPFDETVGRPINRRPSSFEELLQEFEEATIESRHKEKAEEKVKKVQEVDDEFQPVYDTPDVSMTEKVAEKRIRETEARKALQEKASAVERAEAIDDELSRKIRKDTSLGSSFDDTTVSEKRKRGAGGQQQNARRQQILRMLKDPENLKNTIVASEILRPKHF